MTFVKSVYSPYFVLFIIYDIILYNILLSRTFIGEGADIEKGLWKFLPTSMKSHGNIY